LQLYQSLKLKSDNSIKFKNKQHQKRYVVGLKISTIRWVAAASIFIGFISLFLNTLDAPIESDKLSGLLITTESVESTSTNQVIANEPSEIDSTIEKIETTKSTKPDNKNNSIEPLIELSEPLLAYINPKGNKGLFEVPIINAYETGLNELMPLYLDNQLKMQQLEDLFAENATSKSKSPNLALLEGSIRLNNLIAKNKIDLKKYYDKNGNMIAYKVKGEGLNWTKKVNDK
jgi:hypothetical protein